MCNMAWKRLNQPSLFQGALIEHDALYELDHIINLIDWNKVENTLKNVHNKERGVKAWPPLLMFKCLLLQSWYSLSDPAFEKQLARDLLFRRFVGLDITESVPDHSTFSRFRKKLNSLGLFSVLLDELNQQLQSQGIIVKQGSISIIDATVIEADRNRPNKNDKGNITQDPEAGWNVKAGSNGKSKSTYGFKAHLNTDEDGFINKAKLTAGNVHDSQVFDELLTGEEVEVYADSAYKSIEHDQLLEAKGVGNCILHRAYRNKPLSTEQKVKNKRNSSVRSVIERTNGVLKIHYGLGRARFIGIARNESWLFVTAFAHNLKRASRLKQEQFV